ncbi:MAG: hypothetical protein AAGK05_18260 [Pseudomonadota bacterium]
MKPVVHLEEDDDDDDTWPEVWWDGSEEEEDFCECNDYFTTGDCCCDI